MGGDRPLRPGPPALPPDKRHTLLLAFLPVRAEEITDSVLEMFDVLVGRVFSRSDEIRSMRPPSPTTASRHSEGTTPSKGTVSAAA